MRCTGDLMLKFYGIPLVWIRLTNELTDEDIALRREFSAWKRDNDILPCVQGGGGPAHKSEGFKPEDARKVIAWLKDHGAEVDPSIGMA
jgi:hypothetical protein